MIEQKVNTKAATFIEMFKFQGGIYHNALESLTEEDALKRLKWYHFLSITKPIT